MKDEHWKSAFEIIEKAQHLPPADRRQFAESATDNPDVLKLVFDVWDEEGEKHGSTAKQSPPQPGERFGRYEIVGRLGAGGMGYVYSARDLELGRLVALKFVSSELVAERGAVDRLVREAKAASALNHPHIITVYEVARFGEQAAIAMELVDGASLRSCCGSAQPASRVIAWGRQVASALAAAHEKGIVHRDVKPDNVMIRADDYVKVVDFGMARQAAGGELTNATLRHGGTIHYFSPEQARGERAIPPSDVFALGTMLYELATGRHPFLGDSMFETLHQIGNQNPAPPSTLNPLIPKKLDHLILEMLAKRPEARPSAAVVAARLAPEAQRTIPRWIALVAAALAIFGTAAALWFLRRPPAGITFRPLTTTETENRVTAAAISSDGKQLVYADVTGEILLQASETKVTRSLRGPAGLGIDKIAWFRDQLRILIIGRAASARLSAAWIVSLDGSEPRLVRDYIDSASPSPDGSQVAFTTADSREIWLIALAPDAAPRRLAVGQADETFPVVEWSPGGKYLICQRRKYMPGSPRAPESPLTLEPHFQRNYEAIDASTGEVLSRSSGIPFRSAAALPDGRVFFLWSTSSDFSINVWEMKTDPANGRVEKAPHPLTQYKDLALAGITASSDGHRITLVQLQYQPDVYVGEFDPTRHKLLSSRRLTLDVRDDYPHSWSPDSQAVYFESDRNGSFDIFRQQLGQVHAEFITGTPARDEFNPVLTPDGKWILYISAAMGGNARDRMLKRIPVAGGEPATVPIGGELDYFACALAGGKRCVLRTTEESQYVFYELDPVRGKGRELARVPRTPGIMGDWCLSSGGTEVAIPNHDVKERLIRTVPLDSPGPGRVVRLGGDGIISGVNYAAGDSGWFVSLRHEAEYFRQSPLLRVDLVYADLAGDITLVRETPMTAWATVAPSGTRLAFPDGTLTGNAMMLER